MPIPQPCSGTGYLHADTSGAFATLFNKYYAPLVFFARKIVSDPLVAEDIVTETFLKFWQKQQNFSCDQTIKAFLYISTRNACLNHLQQARYQARARESLRLITDDSTDFVLNEITRAEVLREIFYLVESLPIQCRKIVLMSYVAGLTNRQIARRLQLSVHTVRNQKVRGIQIMRSRVQVCV
jgi:RNA polymerase sigma-70 factor (family 1)